MQKDISIRLLEKHDSLEELTTLIHRAYASIESAGFQLEAAAQSVERTRERIARGDCFVAVTDAKLVGTLTVSAGFGTSACDYLKRPDIACFYQWGVDPSVQGFGVGAALWRVMENWTRELGFAELVGHTAKDHARQVAYLQRLGLAPVDEVRFPGDTYVSVVLAKSLLPGVGC